MNNSYTTKKTRKVLLDRKDIERAIKNTKSNRGAARYLGVSFKTYKKIASEYKTEDGSNLYQIHNNACGKGIPKYSNKKTRGRLLIDLLEGKVSTTFVSIKEIKARLIVEGYLIEECCRCKYKEKRNLDQKVPLLLYYVDGNKRNLMLENLQLLCYNCYFITIGDVFEEKQVRAMEDYQIIQSKPIDFDLPKIYEEEVKQTINLENKYIYKEEEQKPDDYGSDLIVSYKKK